MPLAERQQIIADIEELRDGRRLLCFFNFDRASQPKLPGLSTSFASDTKEALFRVLKETPSSAGYDLCLYTRGGDLNSVWPLVSLLREFDPDFEILIPFRCHSSGTLVALGASKIHMGPLSELSPIDPTTGNQFNPVDPVDNGNRMAISVEDVRSYKAFVEEQMGSGKDVEPTTRARFVDQLVSQVHPLALGNVQRVLLQIEQLAKNLLQLHPVDGMDVERVVEDLTSRFYSHLHMINRHEAKGILGDRVVFASPELAGALDSLLYSYESDFSLRRTLVVPTLLGTDLEKECRFIGGAIESAEWSYLFDTRLLVTQRSKIPPNFQVQLPVGQPMPLVPGLPKDIGVELISQAWERNTQPKGITT